MQNSGSHHLLGCEESMEEWCRKTKTSIHALDVSNLVFTHAHTTIDMDFTAFLLLA